MLLGSENARALAVMSQETEDAAAGKLREGDGAVEGLCMVSLEPPKCTWGGVTGDIGKRPFLLRSKDHTDATVGLELGGRGW